MKPYRICLMDGVREYNEATGVELWRAANGRVVIKAYNECGSNFTELDFLDILQWLDRNDSGLSEADLLPQDPNTPTTTQ